MDPDQPLEAIASVDEIVSASVSQPRFLLLQLSLFVAIAVALSAIGVYGVMAHTVAARTRELGIRMAMGADAGSVMRLALGQSLRQAALGIAIGSLLALFGVDLLDSLLFGIAPRDAKTFVAGAALLTFVALAASLVPALRAARVSPTEALRAE